MTPSDTTAELDPVIGTASTRVALPIEGMTCTACASRIERKLARREGVLRASVNYATEEAVVDLSDEGPTLEELISTVRDTGYDVSLKTMQVSVGKVAEPQSAVTGVQSEEGVVWARIEDDNLLISYLPGLADERAIRRRLLGKDDGSAQSVGVSRAGLESDHRYRNLLRRFVAAALLSIPVVVISMSHGALSFEGDRVLLLVLTAPVVFWSGSVFLSGAVNALRHGAADMNTLVAMGVLSAFGYSVVITLWPEVVSGTGEMPAVYFEAAAVIVTLILLGRVLEERAKNRTTSAIRGLLDLQPARATILVGGDTREVAIEAIAVGNRLLVRPGERVPLDGIIREGESALDESSLTGEPIPTEKGPGDDVFAGTVSTSGSLVVEVTRVSADTVLQQIVRLVREAQAGKAPIQRLADRVAAVFVPAVIVVAALTGAVWYLVGPQPAATNAMLRFVTVLIISCPCALGLATPTAIMVATGRAASMGILIRDGAAIEAIASIRVLFLDKTGTITEGRPAVSTVESTQGWTASQVLAYASSVEARSEHPLARAIVEECDRRGIKAPGVSSFQTSAGLGVQGTVDGAVVTVGRESYLSNFGVGVDGAAEWESDAKADGSVVLVAIDGHLAGRIVLSDPVRRTSAEAIDHIRRLGITPAMVTGDRRATANSVGRHVGITEIYAELLPADKVAVVAKAKESGLMTAVVGDGINDAPALAQADVGISMGHGTDIAVEASDMTIMRDDLRIVVDAIRLARAGLRNIKQNLFFAFIYNIILIPVAAGVLYPLWGVLLSPVFASAAMALSSVSVVTNSLRLKRFS